MTHPPRTSPSPAALVALAERAARGAAGLLADALEQERAEVRTKSTGTDMVTEMDRRAEQHVVATILGARPDDGFVGEEGTDRAGSSGVRWIVDPLDGTTNYLYRHPGFAVSIAAEVDGELAAACVLDVVRDECFTATAGGGAARDGQPVRASGEVRLDRALVATGFGYDPGRRRRQAEVLVDVLPRIRDVRRMGAASVDLCSVACGRVDAYFERGLAPWDLAAGVLVAQEAGAVVSDLAGGRPSGEFVLAAAPGVAEALHGLLLEVGAADG